MIHVDRSSVPIPDVLDPHQPNSLGQRELEEATAWFLEGKKKRQRRFPFKAYMHPSVREALTELFRGKCAYCESSLGATQRGDIENYRPKGSVQEAQEHPGYWWLAMDWTNLLIACANCNIGKHNRFPLRNEKMRAYGPGEEGREEPLVLDPTRDDPDEHLLHDPETGEILSETERGQVTIEILGLNRLALCSARARAAEEVAQRIKRLRMLLATEGDKELIESEADALARMIQPDQEYAQLKRQMILPYVSELGLEQRAEISATPGKPRRVTAARTRAAKAVQTDYQTKRAKYSLEDEEGRQMYRESMHAIEAITIKNLRAIRHLDLDLTASGLGHEEWLMLLGENGTGKSTVLQTIALTLIGADYFVDLATERNIHPSDYVRHRCRRGSVTVKLSGFLEPHRLEFEKDAVVFDGPDATSCRITFGAGKPRKEGTGWNPQTVLLAYGATRLLPQGRTSRMPGGGYARVDNLFDPFQPLFDARNWLLELKRQDFDMAALLLKDLLSLPEDVVLTRRGGDVFVNEQGGHKVPIAQLGDGHQTVVALAVDILEVARRVWGNYSSARGIVLIDEIGAHLHPTWKMRIVGSLRNALPGMQFVTTTHQPLCLRGLGEREVVVMRRTEEAPNTVEAITDLPSPAEFRVDQLLTSEFFGLNSTVDPDTEEAFDRYYALLAMKHHTLEQERELQELKKELQDKRHLGITLRENLMYEAIDQLLARQRTDERKPLAELKQEAVDQISRIWNKPTAADPEGRER